MIRAKIQQKLAAAMSGKLADAAQTLIWRRTTGLADKIRGETVQTVEEHQARGFCRLAWSAQEAAALNIPQSDGKAIILQNSLPLVPQSDDMLDFGDGFCRVVAVRQDPVQAVWIVQYRKA